MCLTVDQLHSRARSLGARFEQGDGTGCINEAIVLDREALDLCPPGHPKRAFSLTQLGIHLSDRYKQLGAIEDLNEAIVLDQAALELRPPRYPDHSTSLINLAVHLSSRFHQFGAIEDLDEGILLNREVLALRPPGHPDHSMTLNNLAVDLSTRYKQRGEMEDLDEAIQLGRDALALHPPGHPGRSIALMNLAVDLSTRYEQLGMMEDLNEAIILDQAALELRPPGHPDRLTSLINLAVHLSSLYHQFGAIEDLDEGILLSREALALCPPGHPHRATSLNNLTNGLSTRYSRFCTIRDLDEAIVLSRDALALCPPGHPDRSRSLKNLASCLHTKVTKLGELEDKNELFSLYPQFADPTSMVTPTDLSAARTWIDVAEDFHHPTTLLAYQTSLDLLIHHVASLPPLPRYHTILKDLTSSLAVDAFSACLRNGSPILSVELLEQGRGVFWSQLTHLRSPLDNFAVSSSGGKRLAAEFTQQTLRIRAALGSHGPDQYDRVYRLNVELQGVITRIRKLPGCSRFLFPPLFSDLQQAACEGPVVIVNASKYGCDALVVLVDRNPHHIPLSITKDGVRRLSSRLRTLSVRTLTMDVTEDLFILLRELWDKVVSPIVNFLLTVHPLQSRIWWCPTAEFSLLPLHAAGPHTEGQQNLANLYISSYTSTLTALIRARRHDLLHSASEEGHFLGIGQANAKGENEIVFVGPELANIGQRVDGLAAFTQIQGEESSIGRVTEELRKNEWVHLACHGIPNVEQPFESAFALHDGHFTIERIIQCKLENAQFAFLSACQTTVGDEENADEVMHLASAMQFAGFRSVIGTTWAVMDAVAPMITSTFYD